MKHLFPPLLRKEDLLGPVLVIVAHPDDEVIGCGGMLAWHRKSGHAVTVLHMSDGAAGDPEHRYADFAAVRRAEAVAALGHLGVGDVRSGGLPDGELPEHLAAVTDLARGAVREIRPKTLYGLFATEAHRDHRAVARAVMAVAGDLPADCRCLLFGVNQPAVGGSLFDVSEFGEQKRRALSSYASQLAYNDFVEKVMQRDHGATLNVEDPAVVRVELFADLGPADLAGVGERAESLYRCLLGDAEAP